MVPPLHRRHERDPKPPIDLRARRGDPLDPPPLRFGDSRLERGCAERHLRDPRVVVREVRSRGLDQRVRLVHVLLTHRDTEHERVPRRAIVSLNGRDRVGDPEHQ